MFRSLILAAGIVSFAASPAFARPVDQEAKIARALEGRVAGKPTDCIRQIDIRSSQIFDRTAILYEMSNGTYYLNRPQSGAAFLSRNDILVTDTHSQDLCSIDIVRLLDNVSRFPSGSLGLGPFVPYTKAGMKKRG